MRHVAIALGFLLAGAGWALAQDSFEETRFHRVHLRNGNVIDGTLLKKSEKELILRILSGDISIRVDQIDRVEFIKMRSLIEPPPRIMNRNPTPAERLARAEAATATPTVERVDLILNEMRRAKEDDRFQIAQSFVELGPDGARALTARLGSVEPALREPIINTLYQINEKAAYPELRGLLKHDAPEIRTKAIQLIARLGEADYAEDVRPLIKDPSESVRGAAIDLLRDLGNEADIEAVTGLCSDAKTSIRHKAITAAVRLSSKYEQKDRLVRSLLSQLDRVTGTAKLDILQTLGKLGSKEITQDLARFLRDDSPELRQHAVIALAELDAKDREEEIVLQMARESETGVRMSFALAAQRLRLQSAAPVLIEWLDTRDSDLRGAVSSSLIAITNQDFGVDRARWAAWWEQINK